MVYTMAIDSNDMSYAIKVYFLLQNLDLLLTYFMSMIRPAGSSVEPVCWKQNASVSIDQYGSK